MRHYYSPKYVADQVTLLLAGMKVGLFTRMYASHLFALIPSNKITWSVMLLKFSLDHLSS